MKIKPIPLALGAAGLILLGAGIWLWSRAGLAVWMDAAVAFCT
jgi:hypothetical protein